MELSLSNTLLPGDPRLIDHIVGQVKSQGIFDQFRKECIADVDTKPAYQNLHTRVEGTVNSFLGKQSWKPDLNKNQLRETLRKQLHEAPYLDAGVERIVDQVVNPKVYSIFMPQIEDVVYKFLGIERPKTREKNGGCGLKDLLPKDLDPVSPESDKNSLKDVSLESIDAIDDLESKIENKLCNENKMQGDETPYEKPKDTASENGHISSDERTLDETGRISSKTGSNLNLNTSGKSDDKTEEDEEDSPTFEPIDIMNLNESNISNDSHLSGISELTSHRSRSPDFCNELSRDNFEYSNQDSQLSKVSSDSRLSIVTDLGSSNHASTPMHDSLKDEIIRDKCDIKNSKDNFKAIREFEANKSKHSKTFFELNKGKDVLVDVKDSKNVKSSLSSKENSRDGTDISARDKYENKNVRDKIRDSDSSKSKSKEKNHVKESKYKDKTSDKKKQRSHSSSKYEKHEKSKPKERTDHPRESIEKIKDSENSKDGTNKLKDDKPKDTEKDSSTKEAKDLKDLYKEKIRELREKKELTEKEKLNKDNREMKPNKENRDKKDSPKDKKSYKKEHKSSSSKNSSTSSHDVKPVKSSEKNGDGKERRSESKDKSRRDDRRLSKDMKNKNDYNSKTDLTEKAEKHDVKKKDDKSEVKKDVKSSSDKTNGKKDSKSYSQSKNASKNEKFDGKKDGKGDSQSKEKKRRDEKKSKSKDDHSSLRKNSNDRRSTDRDGSNGSSSKSSQSSNFSSTVTNSKASTSSKETNHVSNSSSETSDSVEETHANELKLESEQSSFRLDNFNTSSLDTSGNGELYSKHMESESNETSLPLKKRSLLNEENNSISGEIRVKKPKFAKNIHEAKKLMKIRKQIEKQKLRENKKLERKFQQKPEQATQQSTVNDVENLESVPDDERVQIIEIPDEEYEEPYPEQQTNLTLEEASLIVLEGKPCAKALLQSRSKMKLHLSDMELCIQQSLAKTISQTKFQERVAGHIDPELPRANNAEESKINSLMLQSFGANQDRVVVSNSAETDVQQIKNKETRIAIMNTKPADEDVEMERPVGIRNNNMQHTDYSYSDDTNVPSTSMERLQDQTPYKRTTQSISRKNQSMLSVGMVDDVEDCRYFKTDNEKSEKFSSFLESFESGVNNTLEDIIEILGGQLVTSMPKAMAPPLPKRKHSSSPLTDILLNNSNNNNDGHKNTVNASTNEDALNSAKKRKLIPIKKQRLHPSVCTSQGLLNGENFVMPLSPESDVSATSEKIPSSNLIKEEKGRHRSSQRYSSDDLYKPRPLFSSSSRRSRRSNQA